MKKRIVLSLFASMLLVFMMCTLSFAAGKFDAGNASDSEVGQASNGKWALTMKSSGTRYVFRIDGVEVDRQYYINHVSDGGDEKVFFGNGADEDIEMYDYKTDLGRSTFFEYGTSSGRTYPGKNEGEPRHVIKWLKKDGNNLSTEGLYYNDFGLNDSNIKLLASTVIKQATEKNDSDTVALMQRVIDTIDDKDAKGGVKIEIRAEILMRYRIIGKSGRGNTAGNPFGIYVTYKKGWHQFLTYNELRAIYYKLGGDAARRHFDRLCQVKCVIFF